MYIFLNKALPYHMQFFGCLLCIKLISRNFHNKNKSGKTQKDIQDLAMLLSY